MFETGPSRVTLTGIWIRSNIITIVLAIFIIVSTIVSALTLGAVLRVRDIVRGHLQVAATQVGEARQQTVRYDFPVVQTFPISTSVVISETVTVPISMTVPIRQEVIVPLEVPIIGAFELPIPINMDVPISTTVDVPIDRELPIETDVSLDTMLPIELDLGEPPLGDVLRELEETLRELLSQL